MPLTQKLTQTIENFELVQEVLSLLSKKTETEVNELWSHLSDKTPDELKKSIKKPKNKRAKTAYSMFSSDPDVTNDLKKKHGEDIKIGEMSKLKSALWKNMSEEDKKVYEEKAKKKNEEEPVFVEKAKKKRKKTPYNMYQGDSKVRDAIVKKLGEKTFSKVNGEMSKMWNEMSDKDKKKYVDLANKANEELNKNEDVENTVEEVKKDEVKKDEVKKDEVKKEEVKKEEVKKEKSKNVTKKK